jgi:signal peptidase I
MTQPPSRCAAIFSSDSRTYFHKLPPLEVIRVMKPQISSKTGMWWGLGTSLLLVGLSTLYVVLSDPVAGLFYVALYAMFAFGIWRRQVWAAIAAAGYQLIPLATGELAGSSSPYGWITVALAILIKNAVAAGFLVAAIGLWEERSAHRTAPWLIVLALLSLGSASFRVYHQPTPSMENTLLVGDRILAERASWLMGRTPQNGNIIMFLYPKDRTKVFIKRVVGIPGDRLRMEGEQLYRNGSAVKEDYTIHLSKDRYFKRFPPAHDVAWTPGEESPFANHIDKGEIVVPDGQYFVLGDNRDNSLDSRYWGFVPRADILSSPVLIYASYEPTDDEGLRGLPKLHTIRDLRWNRLLKVPF